MTGNGFHSLARAALLAAAFSFHIPHLAADDRVLSSRSTVDWKLGRVDSLLTLDAAKSGITLPTGRSAALQMIEMEKPALLKDAFFSVLVDSSSRVGDTVDRGDVSLDDLNRLIDAGRTTPPAFSGDLKTVSMGHQASLHDLANLYLRGSAPWQPKPPLDTAPTRAFTGILVDARGSLPVHGEYSPATLAPCLFPRLWGAEMDLLYDKTMTKPEISRKRGIAVYSSSSDEGEYRSIIGNDPLRVVARELFGKYRTDPVISQDDFLKVISLEANRKLLAEGKIVILCDPAALTRSGAGPERDADFWFVKGEIGAKLGRKPVRDVELTDTWQGLKLVVYDIRFAADTARVLPEERERLDVIAEALKAAGPNARFMVEGHTASVGKPTGELNLSVERARVIARELSSRGIPENHIGHTGSGGTKPVAPNDTDAGRARNRRVDITINP